MTRKEFRKQNKKSPKANLLEVVAAIASIISAVIEAIAATTFTLDLRTWLTGVERLLLAIL